MLGNGHDNHRSDLHGLVVGAVPYPVTYLHLWVKNPRARVKIFKLWRQCLDDINFKLFSCRVSFIMYALFLICCMLNLHIADMR